MGVRAFDCRRNQARLFHPETRDVMPFSRFFFGLANGSVRRYHHSNIVGRVKLHA